MSVRLEFINAQGGIGPGAQMDYIGHKIPARKHSQVDTMEGIGGEMRKRLDTNCCTRKDRNTSSGMGGVKCMNRNCWTDSDGGEWLNRFRSTRIAAPESADSPGSFLLEYIIQKWLDGICWTECAGCKSLERITAWEFPGGISPIISPNIPVTPVLSSNH
ncbi:hypothetical protein DFH06DRAFT_1118306 [Mycena polygramma]|nr:hypothetical protein DFH06DRAFT_1118306 [Mycena polygramma]